MCGLIGIASLKPNGLVNSHEKAFLDLLIMNSVRGPHSTGIFTVDVQGNSRVLKQIGDPFYLINSKEIDDVVNYAKNPFPCVFAGHGRWATKGKITVENAHPFVHGDITMMHNGTLTKVPKQNREFEVDSEALCYSINRMGLAATVSEIQGAYAIVYYDHLNKTLNFARNYQRPLWMSWNADASVLMWSSEKEPLEWVRNRHQINGTFVTEQLDPLVHVEFQLNNIKPKVFKLPDTGEALYKQTKKWSRRQQKAIEESETFSDLDHEAYYNDFKERTEAAAKAKEKKATTVASKDKVFKSVDSFTTTENNLIMLHKKEQKITFCPYEYEVKDGEKESFVLIGRRKDTKGEIFFRCQVKGKEFLQILMDEDELSGTIKSICEVTEKGKQKTLVWIQSPQMLQINH